MPRRRVGKAIPSVEEVIDVLKNGSERKQKELLAPFLTAARMIPLRIDIWHNVERIFLAGVSDDENEDADSGYTTREKELYAKILDMILILTPVIDACSDSELGNPQAFDQLVKLISESALNSRTSDMHTVKEKVLLYVPATSEFIRLKLDLAVSTDQKAKRGWNDPQCASLLIPPRLRKEFFTNPKAFMAKAKSSQIRIRASEFPSFLYADPSKFDPNKPYRGLLKGELLLRIWRCIFTGPSTAMRKDARSPSKSQAEIHKITTVEPFGIVYAAVLARQALSSTPWGPKDLHFDYKQFTEQLLGLFKDEENRWVKNLLSWWNGQVCLTKVKNSCPDGDDDYSEDDENAISVDDLLAQAADDPDSSDDGNGDCLDFNSPLAAGSALAPANSIHRNTLLSVFHDAAQAAQERTGIQDNQSDNDANESMSSTTLGQSSTTSPSHTTPPSTPPAPSASPSQHPTTTNNHPTSPAINLRPPTPSQQDENHTQSMTPGLAGSLDELNANGKHPSTQNNDTERPPPAVRISTRVANTSRNRVGTSTVGRNRGGGGIHRPGNL